MKTLIKLSVLVIIISFSLSFKKGKKPNYPGTVKFKENLYVDKTEISNICWIEYMSWLERKYGESSKEYIENTPDYTVWGEQTEDYAKIYFKHSYFRDYPVVGISFEQANKYCKWRSERVNEYRYVKENKIEWHPDSTYNEAPQLLRYRLPTKDEFEKIAEIGTKVSKIKRFEKKGLGRYNCLQKTSSSLENDSIIETTSPVYSYVPNQIGVFNILGNVAEMVAEKGIAKGGSWIHTEDDMLASKDFKYDKPEKWLGFRCVCEKIGQK